MNISLLPQIDISKPDTQGTWVFISLLVDRDSAELSEQAHNLQAMWGMTYPL